MSDMTRDDLEQAALKNVCSCWYYELGNDIAECDDELLRHIIDDSQYCHKQNQIENPVSEADYNEEMRECPYYKPEAITMSNGGDHWECLCGNDTMSTGFYTVNSNNDFVEPTAALWDTNNYGCSDCGRIIDMDSGNVVAYTSPVKLQEQAAAL